MFDRKVVENSINKLIRKFSKYPNLFLTEADVRCHLVADLLKNSYFSTLQKTWDNSYSIPLHSEVRWYGESGKLKYRSDVVILDPTDLKAKEKLKLPYRLSSKGYGFNKFWTIIELKLRRINGKSDSEFLKGIEEELSKLKKIKQETQNLNKRKVYYYILCFDKRDDIKDSVKEIKDQEIIIKYIFSK